MKYYISLIILFSSINLNAQTKAEKNFGSWYMYHGNHKISKKWSFNTGFQERNYQAFDNYNLTLVYVGVNYKLNNRWTANVSYGYLDIDRSFDPDVVPNTIEHRFYEQISYKTKYFNTPFFHRFRVEHRNLYTMGDHKLINRVRYRLKAKIPIYKAFYGNISNEFFFNFKGDFYTENRFYTAIGYKLSNVVSLETGYLRQYINEQHLNRLQIGILLKTGYHKKEKN